MTSSKTKTGLSETLPNKSTPATPKVFKLNKGPTKSDSNSSSPLPRSRLSIDRSPRSVDSKPIVGRQSPKIATPPEKQQRVLKESELQSQLVVVQEELKKAKESFALAEKEKARVLEELKEAKRISDETSEKLSEALVSQKRAEESSEIEKFRADELEQASIEVAQKREDEWQRELESVRSQHALDVAALLSATQELQRVKHELGIVTDAKTTALSHAEDAMKIAEINAEKVELLSNELGRVKVMLESKSETESNETSELVKKLNLEVEFLKQELERTKAAEKEVAEMEEIVEGLRIELKEEKKAELDMSRLVDEWKKKAELLENQVEEASQSEKSASKSLALATKQLEGNKALLQATESEVSSLKEEVELLEISVGKHKGDLEESNRLLQIAKHEKEEMAKTIDTLRSNLEHIKEEKMNALNNEMVAASTVQSLLEEKNKLMRELEVSRDEEEKSKKAMESLASALHEVSSEARESKEKLLTTQAELQDVESQIENLKLVLQATEEKYETMIDEAEYEIDCLKRSVEVSQLEAKNSKAELDEKERTFIAALNKMEEDNAAVKKEMDRLVEISKADWEERELSFVNAIKETEDELFGVKKEVDRLTNLLKETQDSSKAAKEDGTRLLNTLKQAESDASSAKEVAEKALTESLKLKESLLDKENELQNITQENEELRFRETSAQKKAEELSRLLEETTAKKAEENGDLADSEKDYDLLPKMDELVEENVDEEALQKPNSEFSMPQPEEHRGENLLNNAGHVEPKQNGYGKPEEEDSAEVEAKMWDNCEVNEKDLSPEREAKMWDKPEPEPESFEDELESKIDSDSFDQINGLSSDTMENGESSQITQQKKKKPLLRKFGSLLKKKSNAK